MDNRTYYPSVGRMHSRNPRLCAANNPTVHSKTRPSGCHRSALFGSSWLPSAVARIAAILVLLVASSAGCRNGIRSQPDLWVFGIAQSTSRATADWPGASDSALMPARADLAAAANEVASFCFAIKTQNRAIEEIDLLISDLESTQGKLNASNIQVFRMQPVAAPDRLPGWHLRSVAPDQRTENPLDVLVPLHAPLGGLPASLSPNRTYHFWVDVTVPKGTPAGTFFGTIELTSEEKTLSTIDLLLAVEPFVLPDETDIPFLANLDHRALFRHHVTLQGEPVEISTDDWRDSAVKPELDHLLESTLRLLQSHRLTPVLDSLAPIVKVNAMGKLDVDWEPYDSIVGRCMSGDMYFNHVESAHWPLPIKQFADAMANVSRRSPTDSSKLLADFVRNATAHFDEQGWLNRCYAQAPISRRAGMEEADLTRRFSNSIRQASKNVAVLSTLFPQDLAPYGWPGFVQYDLDDFVDIWMPPAQFFDQDTMKRMRLENKSTWLMADRPPFSGTADLPATPCDIRCLYWQASKLQAQCVHLSTANPWPIATENADPTTCALADPSLLIYPGNAFGLDEPVPSVRLKLLRRSMQDGAYVTLLGVHDLDHISNTIRQALAPHPGSAAYRTHFADGRTPGWPGNEANFDAALRIMAGAITDKFADNDSTTQQRSFAHNAQWRRFMLTTRKVECVVDGVRVHAGGGPASMTARAECSITIVNNKRSPVSGSIGFDNLPAPWAADPSSVEIDAIAPGSSRRVVLSAETSRIATDAAGVCMLPIVFETDDGVQHRLSARLTYAIAVPLRRSIEIDGDLSDWPSGIANVASDFVLITGEPTTFAEDFVSRPQAPTTAFIMLDQDRLVVAVSCAIDEPIEPETARHVGISYDDLIPCEEEMIELLLDPLNAGTRSPTDLYHIVVKQTGAAITEKGIRFDPPCGLRQPWPTDIQAATRTLSDRWVVELSIPLTAFDPEAAANHIWGLNITRFNRQHQEFSTWSAAVRNAYDPLTLGNLYIPPQGVR